LQRTAGPEEGSVIDSGYLQAYSDSEAMSIFCEVIVSVIVRKKSVLNMRLILNGYRDRAFSIHKQKKLIKRNYLLLILF
jgi:hypothetical protein